MAAADVVAVIKVAVAILNGAFVQRAAFDVVLIKLGVVAVVVRVGATEGVLVKRVAVEHFR